MTQNVTLVTPASPTGSNRIETPIGTTANPLVTSASTGSTTTTQAAPLTAGTNRSGTATTTSAQLAAANASRRGLNIQNIGANNIGVNEFGGTAAIGTAGTYTIVPNGFLNVRTSSQINVIAATASTAFTATEF
jgi:hypothetical protein